MTNGTVYKSLLNVLLLSSLMFT